MVEEVGSQVAEVDVVLGEFLAKFGEGSWSVERDSGCILMILDVLLKVVSRKYLEGIELNLKIEMVCMDYNIYGICFSIIILVC